MSGSSVLMKRLLIGVLAGIVLGSLWLFLSNLDQLVPTLTQKGVARESMQWRGEKFEPEFAGGLWHRGDFWRSLNLSVLTATLTACLAALVGIPASWALSRYNIKGSGFIEILFSSIIVLPASTIGLALILLFQYGPLYRIQEWLDFRFMYSIFPGIILAQGCLALAFGISAWKAAFDSINPRTELIARTLGASRWQAIRFVILPMARSGLAAGFVLAWVRAMAEFGSVLLFCGTFRELPISRFGQLSQLLHIHKADVLSIAMWSEIEYGNIEYGFGIAFALVLVNATCVYAIHRLGGKGFVW